MNTFEISDMNSNPPKKEIWQSANGDINCRKIAWNYHIHAVNGEICVEKEINIWFRINNTWKRVHHVPLNLEYAICIPDNICPDNPDQYVYVDNRGAIQFKGGYLKVEDPGLIEPLENTDIELGDEALASVFHLNCVEQDKYADAINDIFNRVPRRLPPRLLEIINGPDPAGKNIQLEVEFESEFGEDTDRQFHPIFYFPQNSQNSHDPTQSQEDYGSIYFGEWVQGNEHTLFWNISKTANVIDPYELDELGLHRVVVSQDADINSKEPYFEFYVNSIGLEKRLEKKEENQATQSATPIKDEYLFGKGPRIFYIGYAQSNKPADLKEEDGLQSKPTFQGGIRRIFFDPNSSCIECH